MVTILTFSIGRLIVRCRAEVGRSDTLAIDDHADLPLLESASPVLCGRPRRQSHRVRNRGAAGIRALLANSRKPYAWPLASQSYEDGRLVFGPRPVCSRAPLIGENCAVLLSDVVGFGARYRNDTDRRIVGEALFGITDAVLQAIPGVRSEDRGDGLLAGIPPTVPIARVMSEVLEELPAALERHNLGQPESARIQLRLAVNLGPVVSDTMIDEAAIRRYVTISTDPAIMPDQLRSLASRAATDDLVTVRVIPFTAGIRGVSGEAIILAARQVEAGQP